MKKLTFKQYLNEFKKIEDCEFSDEENEEGQPEEKPTVHSIRKKVSSFADELDAEVEAAKERRERRLHAQAEIERGERERHEARQERGQVGRASAAPAERKVR